MALTKEQKQELLKELLEKMQQAKSVVFTDYSGTTVAQQTKIRNQIREQGGELKVYKKTLIRLAAKEIGIEEISNESLEGQVAVALSYEDATTGPQIIKKLAKDFENLKLLGGIFEGSELSPAQTKELADLPPREVLLGKLLGSMMAPVQQFAGVSSNLVGGFVRVLNGHKENLEQQA